MRESWQARKQRTKGEKKVKHVRMNPLPRMKRITWITHQHWYRFRWIKLLMTTHAVPTPAASRALSRGKYKVKRQRESGIFARYRCSNMPSICNNYISNAVNSASTSTLVSRWKSDSRKYLNLQLLIIWNVIFGFTSFAWMHGQFDKWCRFTHILLHRISISFRCQRFPSVHICGRDQLHMYSHASHIKCK